MTVQPNISVVVIGFNEARNLDGCFQSIANCDYPQEKIEIIYCDTGSTDGSPDIARKYTGKVFIETSNWPTPGLARNRGLIEARYEIIHFIDGDILLDKDYLKKAVTIIHEKQVDAIYGNLEEKTKSGINSILLVHWKNRKEGFHNATGAGGTYQRSSLLSVNGYDERMRKGEETDLGERYLHAGFKIWFTPIKMGIHDYGIRNLKSFLKVPYFAGRSLFYNSILKPNTKFKKTQKRISRNNLVQNIVFYLCLALTFVSFKPIMIYLVLFFLLVLFKAFKNKIFKSLKLIAYQLVSEFNRFPIFWGQVLIIYQLYISKKVGLPPNKMKLDS